MFLRLIVPSILSFLLGLFLISYPNIFNTEFWGAFWGAFFTLLFGILTYFVTKRRERFNQHRDGLIRLEQGMNKHLHELGVLNETVAGIINSINKPQLVVNRLFHLELPSNLTLELGSLHLVNKVFTYQLSIDRLNLNANSINHGLNRLEDVFISGQTPNAVNFERMREWLINFNKSLIQINERTIKLLLFTRIHINKIKQCRNTFFLAWKTSWEYNITEEEIEKERNKLFEEIQSIIDAAGKDF